VKSVLHSLVQLTDNFPRHEPQNVNVQQQMAVIQAKFKQVSSFVSSVVVDLIYINAQW